MDDPELVRVLQPVADLHQQRDPFGDAENGPRRSRAR